MQRNLLNKTETMNTLQNNIFSKKNELFLCCGVSLDATQMRNNKETGALPAEICDLAGNQTSLTLTWHTWTSQAPYFVLSN